MGPAGVLVQTLERFPSLWLAFVQIPHQPGRGPDIALPYEFNHFHGSAPLFRLVSEYGSLSGPLSIFMPNAYQFTAQKSKKLVLNMPAIDTIMPHQGIDKDGLAVSCHPMANGRPASWAWWVSASGEKNQLKSGLICYLKIRQDSSAGSALSILVWHAKSFFGSGCPSPSAKNA
jgi:hypothetical protein